MIDAARLDEIERLIASAISRAGPAFRHTAGSALDDVMVLAREAIRLRALLSDIRGGLVDLRDHDDFGIAALYIGAIDDALIDVPAGDAAGKEPGAC